MNQVCWKWATGVIKRDYNESKWAKVGNALYNCPKLILPLQILLCFHDITVYKRQLKGVLHPWPTLWLFMHFSQKLQHIGDKSDMFLIGNIPRNLITALEFH